MDITFFEGAEKMLKGTRVCGHCDHFDIGKASFNDSDHFCLVGGVVCNAGMEGCPRFHVAFSIARFLRRKESGGHVFAFHGGGGRRKAIFRAVQGIRMQIRGLAKKKELDATENEIYAQTASIVIECAECATPGVPGVVIAVLVCIGLGAFGAAGYARYYMLPAAMAIAQAHGVAMGEKNISRMLVDYPGDICKGGQLNIDLDPAGMNPPTE